MALEVRRLDATEPDHEQVWGLVGLGLLACAAGVAVLDVQLPPCPFHAIVGLPCPTCGVTRAWYALVEGRVRDSLRLHPLVAPGAVAGLAYLAYACTAVCFGLRRLRIRVEPGDAPALRRIVAGGVACLWLYLIVDGR
jgi:hypothetical protein